MSVSMKNVDAAFQGVGQKPYPFCCSTAVLFDCLLSVIIHVTLFKGITWIIRCIILMSISHCDLPILTHFLSLLLIMLTQGFIGVWSFCSIYCFSLVINKIFSSGIFVEVKKVLEFYVSRY
jgi:hypothetical protein